VLYIIRSGMKNSINVMTCCSRRKTNPDEKIMETRILGEELPRNAVNYTPTHNFYTSIDAE